MPWIPIQFHFDTLVANNTTIFWKIIVPPVLYGMHGFLATWMAVWALFHPYKPYYWPGTKVQVPLTPGIFPKRRSKLAQAVAATVTDTLLTTADIKTKVEGLLTESNIYLSVDIFVESVLIEFRDTAKLHRLASDLAELSPTVLHHLIESTIESVKSGKDHRLASMIEKIFDHVILSARISQPQAQLLASFLMEAIITPEKVRSALLILLTPQNITALDDSIQAHAGTGYKILARLIGIKRVCQEARNFLEKEPEESNRVINDLVTRFSLKEQVARQISNFDLRSLPLQTIARAKENLVIFIESFLLNYQSDLLNAVNQIGAEAMASVRATIINFNPASVPAAWVTRVKQDIAHFAYLYLKRELGVLLEKAIPALGMYSLITNKIDLFTAEQIEEVVKRICKQELLWLEIFGGIIGFFMGILQILVNALTP